MTHTLPMSERPVAPNPHPGPAEHSTHRPPRRVLLAVVLALSLVAAAAAFALRPAPTADALTASGTLEVDEVTLAAQAPGRLEELLVDEGSRVLQDQLVGRVSDPLLDVQVKQTTVDAAQQQIVAAQVARLELRAPLGGVVQKRIAHRGEVVAAGTPILTVADPTQLKLRLYVLQADMGRVFVGQRLSLHADAFADRSFTGTVRTIATRAEFTPRNVQTQKDRQNLVFGVTAYVPNPDGALKAGLPVDATLLPPA